MEKIKIDKFLPSSESDYLNGRPEGEDARKNLKLDEKDKKDEKIEIFISNKLIGINISFFLGLFSKSIVKYKEKEFYEHYKFLYEDKETEKLVKKDIENGVKEALSHINPESLLERLLKRR
ncbi:MAG: hypothetical protein ACRDAQ_07075 [Cetobacterium sp.]